MSATRARRPTWSDEAIIAAIQQWADRHAGAPPSYDAWLRAGAGRPGSVTVHARIGWAEALSRAGLTARPAGPEPTWTDDAIIAAIQRWADCHDGVAPTPVDWQRAAPDHPSMTTVRRRLGWREALSRAGFTPPGRRKWTEDAIVAAVQQWADRHDGAAPTPADWEHAGVDHPGASLVRRVIGWSEALSRAGFTHPRRRPKAKVKPRPRRWSQMEIIEAIQQWAERHDGVAPTPADWMSAGRDHPTRETVHRQIGWELALDLAGFPRSSRRQWSDGEIIEAIRRWAGQHNGVPPTFEAWRQAGADHPRATTVLRRLGWNEAIARAGFTPIDWRRTWSEREIVDAIRQWAAEHGGTPPTCIDWQSSTAEHPAASTVRNSMGWNEAISRAGFTPRERHGGPTRSRRRGNRQLAGRDRFAVMPSSVP